MWFSAGAGVFSTQRLETTGFQQGGRLSGGEGGGCEVGLRFGLAWRWSHCWGFSSKRHIAVENPVASRQSWVSPSFCCPARWPWRQGLARLVARLGGWDRGVGQGLGRVGHQPQNTSRGRKRHRDKRSNNSKALGHGSAGFSQGLDFRFLEMRNCRGWVLRRPAGTRHGKQWARTEPCLA